ncbi:MAG: histidine kinase [Myxococcales bacterium]|nr:histidine kinase [Myxococcales bacterium]
MSKPVIGAIGAAVLVFAGLVAFGMRAVERDRAEIRARLAATKLASLRDAAGELANDVENIGQDLELAAALMTQTSDADDRARELHAIAAIKREYAALELRDGSGRTLARVVAPDAPPDVLGSAGPALDETARLAVERPGVFRTSGPLGPDDSDLAWYRVFARRSPTNDDLIVAVVVDMRPLLARMRLLQTPTARLLVIGARGRPAPSSDPRLAEAIRALATAPTAPALGALMAHIRARTPATVAVGERDAALLGLPGAPAVAVTTPVLIADGEPWALALVVSTTELRDQERLVVRRLLLLGGVAALAVMALAAYVVTNARRAAALHERLRHADRMAHLTEKAEKILDHIPTGVLALTADGAVSAANRALRDRVGGELVGRDIATLVEGRPAPGLDLARLHQDAIASGAVRSRHRVELNLGGATSRVSVHAVPLARPLGDVHSLIVIEDHEPLRQLEEQMLHSEKLVTAGQLAAGIAHEIGTPLNVVRARAELVTARLGRDHPQARDLGIIVDQIDHVTRLLTQLLDYVRTSPQELTAVTPAAALAGVAELVEVEAAKRSIMVRVDCDPAAGALAADAGQLRQVLVNLTINALDACPAGAVVTLRARPDDGGQVVLEVEDSGEGIAPAIRAQAFDPFFTTKKRGRGTGLGLWVVAQLARTHDATIELCDGDGGGTIARLRWPLYQGAA